ncbi:MAG: helix-turn-helix transcriptional regulator [Burkholderiales bacterium]|nr:helix-turn-helix transcriptional regulator [Burkholderiales bacterium]
MTQRGVHLQYRFEARPDGSPPGQRGGDLDNPLFDLLLALREQGSIAQAARAGGQSYRHLWGALKQWEQTLGQPLVQWHKGQAARLTPFAERLLWAETQARARLTPQIEALRADLERVLAEALDGSQLLLTVFASHDLALPLLREQAAAQGLHVDLRFAGSVDALRALAAGRCTVAGFHVPLGDQGGAVFMRQLKPLLEPGRHKLIGCARRRQGLMVAAGNPLGLAGLADAAAAVGQGARFVARQAGSGTRLLLEHLCQAGGLAPAGLLAGGRAAEDSHLAVAAAVASGSADAGLGIEAAAMQFGLGFVPLVEEDYFLVCLREALDEPPLRALRGLLQGPAWRDAVASLPGYAPAHSGEVLSLTQALPWWRFRTPRPPHAPQPPRPSRPSGPPRT